MGPQKGLSVSVPPRSSGAEIHHALLHLGEAQDEVHLLAGSAMFLSPREICGLRALIDLSAQVAGRVVFHSPVSGDLHRYLARVNFYADLPANVEVTQPVPALKRRDRRERLLEVSRIQTPDDVEALFGRVSDLSRGLLGAGSPAARACATAVTAAMENAIEHADSPIGALVAAQRYQEAGLELAVVDLGSGIPATLRRNPRHSGLSDLDAVEHALKDGVSSVQEQGRGAGLAELVRDVGRAGQAALRLSSGAAELTLGWDAGRASAHQSIPASRVRGTWIAVRLAA